MVIIILVLICYCLLLILLWIGWSKIFSKESITTTFPEARITVIVPARNEANNIQKVIESILRQQYSNFEVIVVNDHSEDQTLQRIREMNLANLVLLQNQGTGKKRAITTGVQAAQGSIVVTTDADCIAPPTWLKIINAAFLNRNTMFAFGGVSMQSRTTLFSALQAMELASLIGSAASTARIGMPTMCNGANLAFRKSAFIEVNGYQTNFQVASGDDEFLMRKINKLYPEGIAFMADQNAVVQTPPQQSVKAFFQQRLRWAGKWRYNSSLFAKWLAIFILVSQVCSLVGIVSLFISFHVAMLIILLVKALLECGFLYQISRFLRSSWNWSAFIVMQFLYPFYVIVTGIGSNFISYSWKGRKIQ